MNLSTFNVPPLQLRLVEVTDLPLLYQWDNHPQLSQGNSLSHPISQPEIQLIIRNANQINRRDSQELCFMIDYNTKDGEPKQTIGTVTLYDINHLHRRSAVSILIDLPFQRQGWATQALQMIEGYTFGTLRLERLYAEITSDNHVSQHLFKQQGYKHHATLTDWLWNGQQHVDQQYWIKNNPSLL